MVIARIEGGLGNQLFMYALGRSLAHKNKTKLKLDVPAEVMTSDSIGRYRLGVFNIQENFATDEQLNEIKKGNSNFKIVVEKNIQEWLTGYDPTVLENDGDVYLRGYWQCEKYFKEIEDIIRREITLKKPFGKISAQWKEKILSAECAVSLHVRRGDYIEPLVRNFAGMLPLEYYQTCIEELKKSEKNFTVFVFSDDLAWAKENLKFNVPVEFVEGCEEDHEEMFLMSLCKHNIMNHSTFSWWGAWLNKNPNKKVFTPTPWMRNKWGNIDTVPDDWIKIPVDYEKNLHSEFPPLLSIIIYVKNSLDTINLTLNSVITQNFRDHEIIIVCASDDDTEKICRQFALNADINFLKVMPDTKKISAWNTGLECAQGEYVLFLDSEEFILSQTVQYLCYSYGYAIPPNIVCSVQTIIQNDDGNLSIGGVENKKFSVQVDARFQELQGMAEVEINDRDKMILLATQQINNSLGTKFFKRSFLNKNKIRFDENPTHAGGGSELKFLTEAFLNTEKISFMSQPFFGSLK